MQWVANSAGQMEAQKEEKEELWKNCGTSGRNIEQRWKKRQKHRKSVEGI